ncbi:hypothetical protein [Nonomuraea sp. NPDC049607]|uniref:hypothetical protein n=1 Tax=Nonomuraea sp. NPDC049607 TaxID=3154732 RepID=UPI0034471E78
MITEGVRRANWEITLRVIDGDSSDSPRATTRTACNSSAGSASLSTIPLAPSRNASKTYSSRPKVVSMTTRTDAGAGSPVISRSGVNVPFGQAGGLPVTGRYENVEYDNLAVCRQQSSTFHIRRADNTAATVLFGDGTQGDVSASRNVTMSGRPRARRGGPHRRHDLSRRRPGRDRAGDRGERDRFQHRDEPEGGTPSRSTTRARQRAELDQHAQPIDRAPAAGTRERRVGRRRREHRVVGEHLLDLGRSRLGGNGHPAATRPAARPPRAATPNRPVTVPGRSRTPTRGPPPGSGPRRTRVSGPAGLFRQA